MNGMNVSSARGAICSAIEGHCASMGPAAISMRQSKAMASSCSTTKSGVMPQMCVRAKPWPHVLLAEHVIEELCDLGGQEIARPLGGDRLHGLDGAQIVITIPERERPMECALARVHRERIARARVDGRGLKRAAGLPVEPERRGVELNDRCVGPALCGVENGLDALIETQQPCGEVVRRRDGGCVIGGHIEAARVFHRV